MATFESSGDVAVIGARSLLLDGVVSVIRSLGYRVTVTENVARAGDVRAVVLLSQNQLPRRTAATRGGPKVIALFPAAVAPAGAHIDAHVDLWAAKETLAAALPGLVRHSPNNRRPLSPRERRVVAGYVSGRTKATVANELYVTEGTVTTHLQRSRDKYRDAGRPARNKIELLMRAIEDGIVDCPCRSGGSAV